MGKIYTASLQVRFCEVDLYGHAHHAEIVRYLEWARMEYLKQAGISFCDLMDNNLFIVVVNANLDFRSPAYYDEELVISGHVQEIGTTSFRVDQVIEETKTRRTIVEARFTFVCLDQNRQKIPVPRDILHPFFEGLSS